MSKKSKTWCFCKHCGLVEEVREENTCWQNGNWVVREWICNRCGGANDIQSLLTKKEAEEKVAKISLRR